MKGLRFSHAPAKQLLWLLLWRHMGLSKNKKIGIDDGCGGMKNRPAFKTAQYVGIDNDYSRLADGKKAYPGVLAIMADISKIPVTSCDFALCVQVLLRKHPQLNAANIIVQLAESIRRGGAMIFNISGPKNLSQVGVIDRIARYSFRSVAKIEYGRLLKQVSDIIL